MRKEVIEKMAALITEAVGLVAALVGMMQSEACLKDPVEQRAQVYCVLFLLVSPRFTR